MSLVGTRPPTVDESMMSVRVPDGFLELHRSFKIHSKQFVYETLTGWGLNPEKTYSFKGELGRYPVVCRSWRKSTLRNMFLFLFHYLEKVSSLSCGPVEIYDRSRYQQWRYDCDPEAIEKKMGKQR